MAPDAVITERVYASVRQQILSGRFPPGDRLEVKMIAYDEGTSVTPVRDAIHRLVGERLLELQSHGGFQVPILSEAGLRDLYAWHQQIVSFGLHDEHTVQVSSDHPPGGIDRPAEVIVDGVEQLFEALTVRSGNREHRAAIRMAADRLHRVRLAECAVLPDLVEELAALRALARNTPPITLTEAIKTYHQRRFDLVANLVDSTGGPYR